MDLIAGLEQGLLARLLNHAGAVVAEDLARARAGPNIDLIRLDQ
jgi:hypothetical protein